MQNINGRSGEPYFHAVPKCFVAGRENIQFVNFQNTATEADLSCCSDFNDHRKYFLSTVPHILDSISKNEYSMLKRLIYSWSWETASLDSNTA